jgi:hypothetical protein
VPLNSNIRYGPEGNAAATFISRMPCSLQPFERGSVTALGHSCKTAPRLKDAGHILSEHLFILIGIKYAGLNSVIPEMHINIQPDHLITLMPIT